MVSFTVKWHWMLHLQFTSICEGQKSNQLKAPAVDTSCGHFNFQSFVVLRRQGAGHTYTCWAGHTGALSKDQIIDVVAL